MLQSEMITVTASGADLGETKTRFSEKDEEEKLVSDSLGHKITDLHTQLDQFQQDKRQLDEENSTLTRKVFCTIIVCLLPVWGGSVAEWLA